MSSDLMLGDDETVTVVGLGGISLTGPIALSDGSAVGSSAAPGIPAATISGSLGPLGDIGSVVSIPAEDKKVFAMLGPVGPGTYPLLLLDEIARLRRALRNLNERLKHAGY
jgi:hypothetical protein